MFDKRNKNKKRKLERNTNINILLPGAVRKCAPAAQHGLCLLLHGGQRCGGRRGEQLAELLRCKIARREIGGLLMSSLQLVPPASQRVVSLTGRAPPLIGLHSLLGARESAEAAAVIFGWEELGAILEHVRELGFAGAGAIQDQQEEPHAKNWRASTERTSPVPDGSRSPRRLRRASPVSRVSMSRPWSPHLFGFQGLQLL